jgi:hypothetical protein
LLLLSLLDLGAFEQCSYLISTCPSEAETRAKLEAEAALLLVQAEKALREQELEKERARV